MIDHVPRVASPLPAFVSGSALFVLLAICGFAADAPAAKSAWVHAGSDGRLVYRTLPTGDRIMDFSFAGYRGGGVPLPEVPVKLTVPAQSGGDGSGADRDDAPTIQAAIDAVSKYPVVDGFRGTVLLAAGTFRCSVPLTITAAGVVLRGSGSGPDGTILLMTGKPHVCLTLGAGGREGGSGKPVGDAVAITDRYVPSGATTRRVAHAAVFKVGDPVLVQHPVTAAWVKFMGMDVLVKDGKPQTWLAVGGTIRTERTIAAMTGDILTLDIPLSDCLDARLLDTPGASVVACTPPARLAQIAVERLRIVASEQSVAINAAHHQALRASGIEDSWLRDIAIVDTVNSASLGSSTRRMTITRVSIEHSMATQGSAKPADWALNGSQLLLHQCTGTGRDVFFITTHGGMTGPNVVLQCTFHGRGRIEPHMRWATGLLIDNCHVPEGGINFMNRGTFGSGHGWAIGWAVAWNSSAQTLLIQQPPGAVNWAIGCRGERRTDGMPVKVPPVLPEGNIDAHDTPVAPASLYLAQLRERLGPTVKGLE
jgi:hypothetical protein